MTSTDVPPEVRSYLTRLDRALRPVPRDVAAAIRHGIDEELAGLAPADAIDRIRSLDDPESIAAAAWGESRADATPRKPSKRLWIVGAVAALALAVVLVAVWLTAPGRAAAPVADPTDSGVVAYPMPDLGPSPAPATPGPDEIEQLRIQAQDAQWQAVLYSYPDATRPADPFQEYRDPNDVTAMLGCITAAGLPVELGTNASGGGPVSIGTSASTQAESVAAFTCGARYPTRPLAPMTTEQVDYLYSYLTEYLVPCYEANDIAIPAAPSRSDFVSQWPNQGWFPDSGGALLSDEDQTKLDEACIRPV